jgi:hypothetical protein|tara:strand:+ start:89 stop:436 length:348 start_codon:yes stop_codon:yes gene_type:complete
MNSRMYSYPIPHRAWIGKEQHNDYIVFDNDDKRVYGSKRINLIRISQEKKVKKLLLLIVNWTYNFNNTTESDRLFWKSHYQFVLGIKKHLSSGLNHTLSRSELLKCNDLYKRYTP